jgi:hypothetical protein
MKSALPEEIQAFREARPKVGEYPAGARTQARARLAQAAELAGGGRTGASRRASGRAPGRAGNRPWWPLGLAGGVAVGVAAAITLAVLPGPATRPGHGGTSAQGPSAHGSAAQVLTLAAMTAARQPGPAHGQHTFISEIHNKGGTGRACSTVNAVEWMAPDGSGHSTQTYTSHGCGRPLTGRWGKGGLPLDTSPDAWPVDLYAWQGLPTSPAALEQTIVQRYERGHALASATFVYAGELLELDAPPAVRSALFTVMKMLPGVRNLGPATDQLGRHGIAVALDRDGVRNELIFNPATTRALEYEQVAMAPGRSGSNFGKPWTLVGYTIYVRTGMTH